MYQCVAGCHFVLGRIYTCRSDHIIIITLYNHTFVLAISFLFVVYCRIFVEFTPVKLERNVFVEEVPHALMLTDVILMISDCVVSSVFFLLCFLSSCTSIACDKI